MGWGNGVGGNGGPVFDTFGILYWGVLGNWEREWVFEVGLMASVEFKLNVMPGAGVHKIYFVWYPTFFPKNLSYELRDFYYQKCDKKADIKWNTLHKT